MGAPFSHLPPLLNEPQHATDANGGVIGNKLNVTFFRGAFHSYHKAFEIFLQQRDFYGILKDRDFDKGEKGYEIYLD